MSNPSTRLGTLLYTAPAFQRVAYRLATAVGYVQIAGALFFLPKFMDETYKFPGIPMFESYENRRVVAIGAMSLLLFSNMFWFRVCCKLPERVFMNAPMKSLIIYPIALPPVPRVVPYTDILNTSRTLLPSQSNMAFILDTKRRTYWFSQDGVYTNRALLRNLLNIKAPDCTKVIK